jgi:ribosome-binding protein aMBF1 (putative translation factor)
MSAKGTNWNDFIKEMDLTDDEQAEINFFSDIIGKVVEAREEKGLSQRELAELCGVKQPVIARLERAAHSPQIDTLFKVLRPLGYTLAIVPDNSQQKGI